jgi:DNA repair protein RadC
LAVNAAALLAVHQHPSGLPEPSRADEALTRALKESLALIDVCLIDHIVIGGDKHVSFAERGLL